MEGFERAVSAGEDECEDCRGTGRVACERCEGDGRVRDELHSCTNGSPYYFEPHECPTQRCWKCDGMGTIKCGECGGRGEIEP